MKTFAIGYLFTLFIIIIFNYKGKRAFRTGDMAYDEDGLLFFAGRNDDQIKMYGLRIKLNKIRQYHLHA